jgi:hypothetical protein
MPQSCLYLQWAIKELVGWNLDDEVKSKVYFIGTVSLCRLVRNRSGEFRIIIEDVIPQQTAAVEDEQGKFHERLFI